MLGLYVSDHPLIGAERVLRRHVDCTIAEVLELDDGSMRTVAGIVTGLNRKYTKRGDLMATFVLEDLAATIEVMVFPKTMQQLRRAARTRRDRHGEGAGRRARRHAEADRDGDHPARDRSSTPVRPVRLRVRPARSAPTASTGCTRSCRASRRQPVLRAPRRPRQGDGAEARRRVSAATPAPTSSPSSASPSAPTASCNSASDVRRSTR